MGETFWEPLAELYVILDGTPAADPDENEEVFCLCSRAIMCNPVHQPLVRTAMDNDNDKEFSSEKLDNEIFSNNASNMASPSSIKSKQQQLAESEEPGSCYGSASADEPDSVGGRVRNSSDSGADVWDTMGAEQAALWELHWAERGPQIVLESWRKKYADYIDPGFDGHRAEPGVGDQLPTESSAGPENERLPAMEESMKSLDLAAGKDRGSPLSAVSSDFELAQGSLSNGSLDFESVPVTSSITSSEDSMTDVTRLSTTSAELSLSTDSREDDNATAWQAEWDRHCAEQYAQEYLAFMRSQAAVKTTKRTVTEVSDDLGMDAQVNLEVREVPTEWTKARTNLESMKARECQNPMSQDACTEDDSALLETFASENITTSGIGLQGATGCEDDSTENVTGTERKGTGNKHKKPHKRSRGSRLVEHSVGFLLRSLAGLDSAPVEADEGGAVEGSGQEGVASEAPTNQGAESDATSPANHSGTNHGTAGSGSDDDPPEERPIGRVKRPHEEESDEAEEARPTEGPPALPGEVNYALSLLGLPTATPTLAGHAHLRKRAAAIRTQNRRLRLGHKQPRPNDSRDEAESSGDEPCDEPTKELTTNTQSLANNNNQKLEMEITTEETVGTPDGDTDKPAIANAELQPAEGEGMEPDETEAADHLEAKPALPPALVTGRAKRKRNQRTRGMPPEMLATPGLRKFWNRRFQLFSRYNQGIRLDAESWYSVTPEAVAVHLAERCQCDLVVDAFCGAGGNAIQFAFTCQRVIAIDIDPAKLALARHNAEVYGVADRIEFVLGDFSRLVPQLCSDVVFMSPPWGGMGYLAADPFPLEHVLPPLGGTELFRLARLVSENVAYYLPRNTDTRQVISLGGPGSQCEIEQSFLDRQHVAITAYYGDLVRNQ